MIGVARRISEARNAGIVDLARPHLDEGEAVVHWVRACDPTTKREGFLYLTPRRWILHWTGRADGHRSALFRDVRSWGVRDSRAGGGPLLGVAAGGDPVVVQIPASTQRMAISATWFLRRFAKLAPKPASSFRSDEFGGDFEATAKPVARERKSIAGHTKRVVVTVVGLALVVAGVLLSLPLVPGPGFLVLIAGFAVLAREYDWAKDLLEWVKRRSKATANRFRRSRGRTTD